MEANVYFNDIENIIINELMLARKSIKIAVAWFTDAEFIPYLVRKVRGGVEVEILLHHDDINREGSRCLDFTEFVNVGGHLVWCKGNHSTMHEKFCIIDDEVLIEGTFNWTYYAEARNDEHIIVFRESPTLLAQFIERYNQLKEKYHSRYNISKEEIDINFSGGKILGSKISYQNNTVNEISTPCVPEIIFETINRPPKRDFFDRKKESLVKFKKEVRSLDKQCKPDDYVEEFIRYWSRINSSVSGGRYQFEKEGFDLQKEFDVFGRKYEDILAARAKRKRIKNLESYADSFRKDFHLTRTDHQTPIVGIHPELDICIENFKGLSDKLKDTPAKDVCVSQRICGDVSTWEYLKNIGVPCVADKEGWFRKLLSPGPARGVNNYSDCFGYNYDGITDIGKHVRNIKSIEESFNTRFVVRDYYPDQADDAFIKERALYIKMLKEGYSFDDIKECVNPASYVGNRFCQISVQNLKELALGSRGLKAYSYNILEKIEKSNLLMDDIYDYLNIKCPKTYSGFRWWQRSRLALWLYLPIRIITEDTCFLKVAWTFQKLESCLHSEAFNALCDVDLSIFRNIKNQVTRYDYYWIPQEIVNELPQYDSDIETFLCPETEKELLSRPIDFYYSLFENFSPELEKIIT